MITLHRGNIFSEDQATDALRTTHNHPLSDLDYRINIYFVRYILFGFSSTGMYNKNNTRG